MLKNWKLAVEDTAELLQSQRELHDALPLIDKMEECGINCAEIRRTVAEMQQRAAKMLEHFGSIK